MSQSTPSAEALNAELRSAKAVDRDSRAGIYALLVAVALIAGFFAKLRFEGVFACPAAYAGDSYLAYCQAEGYGDYDHGALWFGLEPEANAAATRADVLFLGSSRLQFALSGTTTAEWFRERGANFYLLGLSHTENTTFAAPLIERLEPRARVYVVNVDRFFDDVPTAPGSTVLGDPEAFEHYRAKRRWQAAHERLCGVVPSLCGSHAAFYRMPADGRWHLAGTEAGFRSALISVGKPDGEDRWPRYAEIAEAFVADLPVARECVLLTLVPSTATRLDEARFIADRLGMPLISPAPPGLMTYDGSHLEPGSAEAWSREFLDAAGSTIERCLSARGGVSDGGAVP